MAINKGLALVSVADVLFFNPITGDYMGEGLALTNSTLTQEVQSIEQRGGYLNALLFDIKHSKNVTVELESATFKMEYLAFQTGIPMFSGPSSVYKFDECVSFTNGIGTTAETPLGNVFVRMPNGVVKKIQPTGKNVDIGMPQFSGSLQVVYKYNEAVDQVTIDTKTQPFTVKAVMRVHVISQDGVEGFIEITIPRLKFDGSITLNMASDAVSTFGLSGTAQEYATDCGESYYADVKYIKNSEEGGTPVEDIVASPNVLTFSLAGVKTATANIIGIRTLPYSNVTLDNAKVTFQSADQETASVTEEGLITGLKAGNTTITVSYEGFQDTINVNVGE
ncbi:MAG: Ig-like domain-containing protein [Mollicutes bacterium]|nr:Ig-like domain-containing protein [Mollicutes bacterium]